MCAPLMSLASRTNLDMCKRKQVNINMSNTYMHITYICIRTCGMYVCCEGDFKGKTVHTFMMCAHFADVSTLHLMFHCE